MNSQFAPSMRIIAMCVLSKSVLEFNLRSFFATENVFKGFKEILRTHKVDSL